MDTQKLLDDLFEGKQVNPPRQFLAISAGKYVWCDTIYTITDDANGNPIPEPYNILIIKNGDKEVAFVMYSVDGWYNFDPVPDKDITAEKLQQPLAQCPEHVMFG